jgi:hypothetical protein
MIWRLIRCFPYVRELEKENVRLRSELDFERKVTGNQQKVLESLTAHRDILLSSLAAAEREVKRLKVRKPRYGGTGKEGGS